ncbi:MAG: sulfatase-like hydrolase/transferase [Muriicola sp.]|nr:sulfatase-like hydrolase/transferase [Muriicola sp.]NNK11545.1 sulfatase-like hydrolase/transferase [Flavobacteriaceae bacterium]
MQTDINIGAKKRDLRDFIRLVLAFFLCLGVLSLYQNTRLYGAGVLDGVFNKSFLLLLVHHLGFTSLTALFLVFLYKFLERLQPNLGFKTVVVVLVALLGIEGLLTKYYVDNYEILGAGFSEQINDNKGLSLLYYSPVFLFLSVVLMYVFFRMTTNIYDLISRMYPFTIILFSLFLATLITRKNPVNENKTQHLIYHRAEESLNFYKYEGQAEYPLLKSLKPSGELADYFQLKTQQPNLVFIVLDGVGSDFVGENASYKAFMPYLNGLVNKSLYWPHNLSNTGESTASIPTILGSLPFGEEGFSNIETNTNRYTLIDLLKQNGYYTSFHFGGNASLNNLGKFLYEEEIDYLSDRKAFGPQYKQQQPDAAGISLGYPDAELFSRWLDDFQSTDGPRVDIFLTQSTKNPFHIPNEDKYEMELQNILASEQFEGRSERLIEKNEEVFSSLLYADKAMADFMEGYKRKSEYYNTIFIITGSHNLSDLPQSDYLDRYRVPLLMYSPMLKSPARMGSLVAHSDILPELAGLYHSAYKTELPEQVAWLGDGLVHQGYIKEGKEIPLFRHRKNIQEFIKGNLCISGNSLYKIGSDLSLYDPESTEQKEDLKSAFREFKAINQYVTEQNKLIPVSNDQRQVASRESKSDMVWINSVFNSDDYDNAYRTARDLAIEGDKERALLLCDHILKEVPGHADTEILKGRIYAWNQDYTQAAIILEKAIRKYPVYADGYSALLDVYFWADTNYKVTDLKKLIRKHRIGSEELTEKIKRAEDKMKQDQTLFSSENLGYLNFEEDGYE